MLFPTHLNNKKVLLRRALNHLQTLPTPLLGTLKNPNPFSCFVLTLPKPFSPLSWDAWAAQTLLHGQPRNTLTPFHGSFWGDAWAAQTPTHDRPCFILRLPNPSPPNSCFSYWKCPDSSQILPCHLSKKGKCRSGKRITLHLKTQSYKYPPKISTMKWVASRSL